jgi:hypothetical protein
VRAKRVLEDARPQHFIPGHLFGSSSFNSASDSLPAR